MNNGGCAIRFEGGEVEGGDKEAQEESDVGVKSVPEVGFQERKEGD